MSSNDGSKRPRVSIVLPAYESQRTIARSLERIEAQSWRDFEIIVVDSSPTEETGVLIRERFPRVHLLRSATQLNPQAARNRGVQIAQGELLVFTDPDIYPSSGWLATLVEAHDSHRGVVVGSLECHGSQLLHRAMHLCKFSKWLPYGSRRIVDMSPTGNMLIRREEFDAAGGLAGDHFLADVTLTRALQARGTALVFEPGAVVEHHHEGRFAAFLRIRFMRGIWYGEMRAMSRMRALALLAATLLPLRLPRIAVLTVIHIARGSRLRWLAPFPFAMLGHVASLSGEAAAYVRVVFRGW